MKRWLRTPDNYELDLKDAMFVSWVLTGLRHEFIRLSKKRKWLKKHELLILNNPVSPEENEGVEVIDFIADKVDILKEVEESLSIQEALSLLTSKQRKVIVATVLLGNTEKEVAQGLGLSQPAVHGLKKRALKKLKKHYLADCHER